MTTLDRTANQRESGKDDKHRTKSIDGQMTSEEYGKTYGWRPAPLHGEPIAILCPASKASCRYAQFTNSKKSQLSMPARARIIFEITREYLADVYSVLSRK